MPADRPSYFMPVNWGNALEREMIEIKDEIPYLVIFGFLVFSREISPSR